MNPHDELHALARQLSAAEQSRAPWNDGATTTLVDDDDTANGAPLYALVRTWPDGRSLRLGPLTQRVARQQIESRLQIAVGD